MRTTLLSAFISLLIPATALAVFPDTVGHPYAAFIDTLRGNGIVQGYDDGTFHPDKHLNRAEFLKITMLAVFGEEALSVSDTRCFKDFSGTPQWYWVYACAAKQRGIIHGYPDGTFRGEQNVNVVEALKMAVEAWNIPLPQYIRQPDNWYAPYIDATAGRDVHHYLGNDYGKFLTRGEMSALITNMNEPLAIVRGGSATCGDGFLHSGEECDDGNNVSGDCCTNQCVVERTQQCLSIIGVCGNGIVEFGEQCDDGNIENGDGCSKICVIVPEPTRHGALQIDQRPAGTSMYSAGAGEVVLLELDALAGRQDVRISTLKFKAASGTLADLQGLSLYSDENGDGKPETLVASASPQGSTLTFGALNVKIKDGFIKRLEVRGTFRSTISPTVFGLRFATEDSAYVQGVGLSDGRELSGIETNNSSCTQTSICWIAVYTQPAKLFSISERGNVFITQDSTPVPSRLLVAGKETDTLLRLKFFAQDEDVSIEKLRIGGGNGSIDHLALYLSGQSTPFARAYVSGCESQSASLFCVSPTLVIPKDQEKVILVKAVLKSDVSGAVSGGTAALSLSSSTSSTSAAVDAQGAFSLQDLDQNDGDTVAEGEVFIGRSTPGVNIAIIGSTHDIVLAKISGISNASADSDNTAVPVGVSRIGVFRFDTASHTNSLNGLNTVEVEKLVFTVSATNVQFDPGMFKLLNTANNGVKMTCSETGTTGSFTVSCSGLDASDVSTVISQGSHIDLALEASIANPQVSPGSSSTVQVSLNQLGDRNATGTIEWNDEVSGFGWVDTADSYIRSVTYRNQ